MNSAIRSLTICATVIVSFPPAAHAAASLSGAAASAVAPKITAATYLGGDGRDAAVDLAVDPQGNVYVLGNTAFGDLDTGTAALIRHTASPFDDQPFLPPGFVVDTTPDAMVIKYAPDLKTAHYFATIGGSGRDEAIALEVDAQGNPVLLLRTESLDFPTRNALQPKLRGESDLAIVKLSSDGRQVIFSTYLGGDFHEVWVSGRAELALDQSGQIYVAGTTFSQNFPVTSGAFQTQPGAAPNGFVTKLTAEGKLVYSTYLGGSGNDEGQAVVIDGAGSAFVGGITASSDFPLVNPINRRRGVVSGPPDPGTLFLAKLNAAGSALEFSTLLIGSGAINSLAVTPQGSVVLAGSTTGGLSTTPNALQREASGGFILELNRSLNSILFASRLGAASRALRVAADAQGNLGLTGATTSGSLLTSHEFGADNSFARGTDAFAVKFDSARKAVYSIRIGGTSADEGRGAAFLPNGDLVLAGNTASFDFPVVAPLRGNPVSDEGFVMRVTEAAESGNGSQPGAGSLAPETYTDRESGNLPRRFYRVRRFQP